MKWPFVTRRHAHAIAIEAGALAAEELCEPFEERAYHRGAQDGAILQVVAVADALLEAGYDDAGALVLDNARTHFGGEAIIRARSVMASEMSA